jgi:hypothetical protein
VNSSKHICGGWYHALLIILIIDYRWTQSSGCDYRPSLHHKSDQLLHPPTAIHMTERTRWEDFATTTRKREPNTFKPSPAVFLLLIHPFLLSHILVETRDQPHFRPRPLLHEESGEAALAPHHINSALLRRPRSYDLQTSCSSPPLFHISDVSATAKDTLWFRNGLVSKYL